MFRPPTFLPVLLTVALALPATGQEHPHHPVNLVLLHPIGTNQDVTVSTNLRLNVFYSHIGALKGVDLSAGVARTDRDFRGLQFTGLASYTGGDLKAISFTGGVNFVRGDASGVQITGLTNFNRGDFRGVQYAGLFNFVEGQTVGAQISPTFNLTDGDARFLQLGTIANGVGGSFRGLQLSTGVNFANDEVSGAQVGLMNVANEFRGVQLGVFNAVRYAHGMQIGVLNLTRESHVVPIGLMSFADDGNTDWVSYGTSYAAFNSGVRTIVRGWSSTLTLGVGDLKDENSETAFASWHFGPAIRLGDQWTIAPDVGYVHVMPQPKAEKNNKQHWAVQGRILIELRLSEKFALFTGGGFSAVFAEYRSDAESETDPLAVFGVSLF